MQLYSYSLSRNVFPGNVSLHAVYYALLHCSHAATLLAVLVDVAVTIEGSHVLVSAACWAYSVLAAPDVPLYVGCPLLQSSASHSH